MMTCVNGQLHRIHKRRRYVVGSGRLLTSSKYLANSSCVYYEFFNFEFRAVCGNAAPDYYEY